MVRWEYCILRGVAGTWNHTDPLTTNYPRLYHFTESGLELVDNFQNRPRGLKEKDAVHQKIAQLGLDGWEMVLGDISGDGGSSISISGGWILFKRPKV